MYVVHRAVRPHALDRLLKIKARVAAALVCCIALAAGCGDKNDSAATVQQEKLPTLPVALRYAECSDWRKGSIDERRGTIRQIREFAGGPVGSSEAIQKGRVLDDNDAYLLIDRSCSKRHAIGFRLYLLYTHAAAFAGTSPPSGVPKSKNPSGY
jgi:hypothetical protein